MEQMKYLKYDCSIFFFFFLHSLITKHKLFTNICAAIYTAVSLSRAQAKKHEWKKKKSSFLLSLFCSTFRSIICLNPPSSHFVLHLCLTPCLFSVIHPSFLFPLSLYYAQRSAILLAGFSVWAVDWVSVAHGGYGQREIEKVRMSSNASDAWKTQGGVFKSEVFHSIPLHHKGPPWMRPATQKQQSRMHNASLIHYPEVPPGVQPIVCKTTCSNTQHPQSVQRQNEWHSR